LTEIIKHHAPEILGRQETQGILDTLKKDYPAVVEEVQKYLSLGEIQKVLQGLLQEQVSIRNMVAILEALADYGPITKDPSFLIEKARQALGRQLCLQYADEDRVLRVLTLERSLEQRILDSQVKTTSGLVAALEPSLQRAWIKALGRAISAVHDQGLQPVILCSEQARYPVKSSCEREFPNMVVLSVPEIVPDVNPEVIGEIRLEEQG
jgi:flagellar biosynthesis protein FlhA